jgi:hypothetical protein
MTVRLTGSATNLPVPAIGPPLVVMTPTCENRSTRKQHVSDLLACTGADCQNTTLNNISSLSYGEAQVACCPPFTVCAFT